MPKKKKNRVLAIIPARGGSKGLPLKNIQQVGGHPLIAYTIEAAKRSKHIDEIFVATDSEKIQDSARAYGIDIPFLLPDEITQDNSRLEDVFAYVPQRFLEEFNKEFDYICFLDPCRPVREEGFIDGALEDLFESGRDSIISGVLEHKSVWKEEGGMLRRLDSGFTVRQLKKDRLFICYSGLITCTRTAFMLNGERLGQDVSIFEFDDFNMTTDIHTKDDLDVVDFILGHWDDRYVTLS